MSDIVIKAENIGKLYKLGEIGTGTISHDLNRWWARVRGKEDPFAKIGAANDRTVKGDNDWVWALKDVNFEVRQGEVLGIIGRNGAGKSTLLKILSKVTTPSTGRIKVKGRIASLLEVGTGFHPELTGRENVFLNGAILGMTKAEIKSKFDEIVDFSGVEKFLDTPVKRYSSGMYVRLAFAVAAHLEPEILVVDEVLAVGDAEFQKKCLGKMDEVTKKEGRTVLFVSHNMTAIQSLCTKGLLLQSGSIVLASDVTEVVDAYLDNISKKNLSWYPQELSSEYSYFSHVEINISGSQPNLILEVSTEITTKNTGDDVFLAFYLSGVDGTPILESIPIYKPFIKVDKIGKQIIVTNIKLPQLIPNFYTLTVWMGANHIQTTDWQKDIITFEITESPMPGRTTAFPKHCGFLITDSDVG